ncbi:hypothetical protein CCMSSC00406_0008746 [Pleurotus cornucopiae]|uniref:Uncharacterized protein n=1 Tax=Pleurotus cornucopiae TaxID=5321 RepID=A0ACB7J524_PLECO|nr:hypothetical protein CCMSSC00406_0008746 [Pleurotus cornucopiae]
MDTTQQSAKDVWPIDVGNGSPPNVAISSHRLRGTIFGSTYINVDESNCCSSPPTSNLQRKMSDLVRDSSFCVIKKTWTLKASAPTSIRRLYVPLKNFTAEDLPNLVANFERNGVQGFPPASGSRALSSFCSSRASFSDFLNGRLPPSQHAQQPQHLGQYISKGHWVFQYLHPNQDEEGEFDWCDFRERRASSVFSRESTPRQTYPYNPMVVSEADGYLSQQETSLSREASSLTQLGAASRAPTPLRHSTLEIAQVPTRRPSMDATHQQATATPTHDDLTAGPSIADPAQGRRYPSRDRRPPKPRYDPIIPARRSTHSTSRRSSPVKASLTKTKEADLACHRCSKDFKTESNLRKHLQSCGLPSAGN